MICGIFKQSEERARLTEGPISVPELSEEIVKEVRSHWPFANAQLQQKVETLTPRELTELVHHIISRINPEEVEKVAEMIPLGNLEKAVRLEYPQQISALQTAKAMFHEAKYFLETTASQRPPSLTTRLSAIVSSCISILESILAAFGIASLFTSSENSMESEFKGQKIMMLLTLFTMISSILIPLIGAAQGAAVLGGIMLAIAAFSLIYPHIKPASIKLPRADNWSQKFLENQLLTSHGRQTTLNEIAHTLIASKKAKNHVMLIGKTGIGKTETVKAFVQAVERGDYPLLKGKQIHYINTAELLSGTEPFTNGNKILQQISKTMGKHRENYILIFDEIHIACQKKENSVLSEQLKTLLEQKKDNFPYVIGITTEEEFFREIYVHNAAFARRFKRIVVDNTSDRETLHILNNTLLQQAPSILLERGSLESLLQKTKEAFGERAAQPATSLKILSQCITRISDVQKMALDERVEEIRSQFQALCSEGAIGQGNRLLPYGKENGIEQLEESLYELENLLAQQKEEFASLQQDCERLAAVKRSTFEAVLSIQQIAGQNLSRKQQTQINTFLLQSHYLAPALEKSIQEKADRLEVNVSLNDPLIDQVIREELENDQKTQDAIQRGKRQIEERSAI